MRGLQWVAVAVRKGGHKSTIEAARRKGRGRGDDRRRQWPAERYVVWDDWCIISG